MTKCTYNLNLNHIFFTDFQSESLDPHLKLIITGTDQDPDPTYYYSSLFIWIRHNVSNPSGSRFERIWIRSTDCRNSDLICEIFYIS